MATLLLLSRLGAAAPLQACEADVDDAAAAGRAGPSLFTSLASTFYKSIGLPGVANYLARPRPAPPAPSQPPSPPMPAPAPASPPPLHHEGAKPPAAAAAAAAAAAVLQAAATQASSTAGASAVDDLPDVGWTDEAWARPSRQPEAVGVADAYRQRRVRSAFAHAWSGYRTHAWGTDELDPRLQHGVHSYGMGLTLVDSLDTLVVMGMGAEVAEAVQWIEGHLHFGKQEEINLFEVRLPPHHPVTRSCAPSLLCCHCVARD